MARLRYNGVTTTLGGAIDNDDTAVTFSTALTYDGGTNVPTLASPDYVALSLLDADGVVAEVVHLTAYTAGATSGTISRGQDGTTGVSHASGATVVHSATTSDHCVTRYKTADESVTSNTTLQNDDHLLVPAGANETWVLRFGLHFLSASGTPDIKCYAFGPSGATIRRVGGIGLTTGASTVEGSARIQSHTTGTITFGAPASGSADMFAYFEVVISTAGTAGNIGLQWAQNTSDASATTLKQWSNLVATRLA